MDKIWIILKREYLERIRTRWFIISTLMVPAIMIGFTAVPLLMARNAQPSAGLRNIAVLDATGTDLGSRIVAGLAADTAGVSAGDTSKAAVAATRHVPQLRIVSPAALAAAETTATAEVIHPDSLTGFLVLTDSTLSIGTARYSGRDATSIADIGRLEGIVRQNVMIVRLQQAGVAKDLIGNLGKLTVDLQAERLSDQGHNGSAESGIFIGFGIAFMLYFSIIMHGQNVMRGVLEEKMSRVAEVVLSSVKPDALLAGKVLGVGAVGLTQQIAWVGLTIYFANFLAPFLGGGRVHAVASARAAQAGPDVIHAIMATISLPTAGLVLAFFLAGFILYAALYAAIGAMVSSEQEAQQAAMPVMFLLIGTFFFVNGVAMDPNGPTAVVLTWIPFSAPIIVPMRMVLNPLPWPEVAGSLLVAFGGCAASVWVAARIYRIGMLMYGKRPSIAELVKWVRYA